MLELWPLGWRPRLSSFMSPHPTINPPRNPTFWGSGNNTERSNYAGGGSRYSYHCRPWSPLSSHGLRPSPCDPPGPSAPHWYPQHPLDRTPSIMGRHRGPADAATGDRGLGGRQGPRSAPGVPSPLCSPPLLPLTCAVFCVSKKSCQEIWKTSHKSMSSRLMFGIFQFLFIFFKYWILYIQTTPTVFLFFSSVFPRSCVWSQPCKWSTSILIPRNKVWCWWINKQLIMCLSQQAHFWKEKDWVWHCVLEFTRTSSPPKNAPNPRTSFGRPPEMTPHSLRFFLFRWFPVFPVVFLRPTNFKICILTFSAFLWISWLPPVFFILCVQGITLPSLTPDGEPGFASGLGTGRSSLSLAQDGHIYFFCDFFWSNRWSLFFTLFHGSHSYFVLNH